MPVCLTHQSALGVRLNVDAYDITRCSPAAGPSASAARALASRAKNCFVVSRAAGASSSRAALS